MYKNMVRKKGGNNNLPYVSSRPGSKQGSGNGKQMENNESNKDSHNKYGQ